MKETPIAAHGRMHALDGLRATMMLLGLVLHTAVSYTVIDLGAAWGYKDTATTPFADLVVMFIHVFRMPVFFVLAGFFAAMLCVRRGVAGFVNNRLQRIVLPFVVAVVLLYPLVVGGFVFSNAAKAASIVEGWAAVTRVAGTPVLYVPSSTMHLWFIYYLIYFYAGALALSWLSRFVPAAVRARFVRGFHVLVANPILRVSLPALVTTLTLLPMAGILETRAAFTPDVDVLLAYAVFFGFGWLLYREHALVASFKQGAWSQTLVAALVYGVFQILIAPSLLANGDIDVLTIARSVVNGGVVWLLVFGLAGLFLRYFDRPSARVRYVVDASYWVYLVHLPCVIWIPGLLVHTEISVWSRMAIVLAGATAIGFGTYSLFVRSTWIGRVLNGRRYARGLPDVAPAPAS